MLCVPLSAWDEKHSMSHPLNGEKRRSKRGGGWRERERKKREKKREEERKRKKGNTFQELFVLTVAACVI